MTEERDPDNHPPHSDSNFEISIRVLGNEIFALALISDSMNKKFLAYAIVTMFLFMLGIAFFGDTITNFVGGLYNATTPAEVTTPVEVIN